MSEQYLNPFISQSLASARSWGTMSGGSSLPTPDYETDFSDGGTGWVEQNATNISVSTSGISFKTTASGNTIDNIAYDLGSGNVSDTKWSLRYSITYTGQVTGNGQNQIIGLGSLDGATGAMSNPYTGSGGSSTPENRVGFSWIDYSGTAELGILSAEGWYSNADPNNPSGSSHVVSTNLDITGTVKYYVTIIRHSATKITMDITTGSFTGSSWNTFTSENPPSTDGVYSNATPTSSLTDLRYIKIWNRAKEGTRSGKFTGIIDYVAFWDDIIISDY